MLRALNVSRETEERLDEYHRLFLKWNKAINLVSSKTIPEFWTRHILDSAQIWDLRAEDQTKWADLGSGGGLPGLILAILGYESNFHVTMVESDKRKSAFLMTVSAELGLKTSVVAHRIEMAEPQNADVVSARALAPLNDLLGFSKRHLSDEGTAIFLKGRNWQQEVDDARENWAFSLETFQSKTDQDAVLLRINRIERV